MRRSCRSVGDGPLASPRVAAKRASVGLILLAVAPPLLAAQGLPVGGERAGLQFPEAGPSGIAIGLDLALFHQADDLVSPLRYSGLGYGLTLRVGMSTPSSIRVLSASHSRPQLDSRATGGGGHLQEGHRASLEVMALQRVATLSGGGLSLFLGGSIAGDFALYDHRYTRTDSEGWLHAFGLLEPGLGWSADLPWGGRLWQSVTVPLFGLVFRPGYEGLTEAPEATWAGIGEVEGVQQSLHYLHRVGGLSRLGLSYGFSALRYKKPRTLSQSRHSLTLSLTIWGGGGGS